MTKCVIEVDEGSRIPRHVYLDGQKLPDVVSADVQARPNEPLKIAVTVYIETVEIRIIEKGSGT